MLRQSRKSIVIPHKGTVRTYSLITSISNSLFNKKREKQTKMKTEQSKFIPFNIVETDEGKTIITLGKYKASPIDFTNKKEAETYLKNQPYEMFFNLLSIIKHYENENKSQNPQNMAENA